MRNRLQILEAVLDNIAPESDATNPPRITVGFNFAIFGAWLLVTLLQKANTLAQLYQSYQLYEGQEELTRILTATAMAAFAGMGISLIIAGVLYFLLTEIWKRFIVDVFSVRMITRTEACALVLISLFL